MIIACAHELLLYSLMDRTKVRLAGAICTQIKLAFGVSRVSMVHAHTWTVLDSPLGRPRKLCRCHIRKAVRCWYAVQKSKDRGESKAAGQQRV